VLDVAAHIGGIHTIKNGNQAKAVQNLPSASLPM
jgi:hypothetical protein